MVDRPKVGAAPAGYTRRRLRKAEQATQGRSDDARRHARHARRRPEMGRHHAAPGRADPEAAAGLPADDPGTDEHVHAAAEHPGVLPGRASPPAAAELPAAGPAGHAAGPRAAAHAPAAGAGPAAELPAGVPADFGHLLAAVQRPGLPRRGKRPDRPRERPDRPEGGVGGVPIEGYDEL